MRSFLVAALISLSLLPHASAGNYCDSTTLQSLSVPIDPQNPPRGSFSYKYRYDAPESEDLPVVVYIPGGPGFGSLDEAYSDESLIQKKVELGIPEGFGLLLQDPRGVECNSPRKGFFTDSELGSDRVAGDLLQLIRKLQLKNYVLYGHSYGTVVATHLAARLESGVKPQAVILSGVVGKASHGGESSIYKLLQLEWERLKQQLPVEAVRRLSLLSPLGIGTETWGAAIEAGLTSAASLSENAWTYEFRELLATLARNDPQEDAEVKARILKMGKSRKDDPRGLDSADDDNSDGDRVYQTVYCNELADSEFESQLVRGRITFVPGSDLCAGRKMSAPYDSKRYVFSPPVFYFNGTVDPATSLSDAIYHFKSHSRPHRYLVSLTEGGHHNLGLFFGDCHATFWTGLLAEVVRPGSSAFANALEQCVAHPQLTLKEAH